MLIRINLRKRPSAIKSFLRFRLLPQNYLATILSRQFIGICSVHLVDVFFFVAQQFACRALWSNNRQLTEIYFDHSLYHYKTAANLPATIDRNTSQHDEEDVSEFAVVHVIFDETQRPKRLYVSTVESSETATSR